MQQGFNYVANITSVTIQSYTTSSTGTGTPGKAILYVRQYELDMFSSVTSFNLVSDNTLNLGAQIGVDGVSASEISLLESTDTTLFAWRSNLTLSNLRIQGDLENDSQTGSYFLRPIYLQDKFLTLTNLDIQLTGYLLRSFDPMSMDIQNVYVDFHAMMGGFWMNIDCNYPEAYKDGILRSSNLTAENAFTRIAPFRTPFLVTSGPEDIYFEDSNIFVWGSLQEDRAVIETYVDTNCLPTDTRDHSFTFINTRMSQSDNPEETKFTSFFVSFDPGSTRRLLLNYIGGIYYDQYQMPYPTHHVFSNLMTEISIINATFTNVTGVNGGTMTTLSASVLIDNTIYQNWDNFGFDTFLLLESDMITLRNLTHLNVNGTGSSQEYYVMMQVNEGGTAQLDSVNFYNWDLKQKPGLHFEGMVTNLVLENSVFSEVKVGTGNAILNAQQLSVLTFTDTSFENIESSTLTDEDNLMINLQTFNLDNSLDSTVSNITVESSSISFLSFNSIIGTLPAPITFSLSSLAFRNCHFDSVIDIVSFGNLETEDDISYEFSGVVFSNISFTSKGQLLSFHHQLENEITITNASFSDITGGKIYAESGNKQNPILKTRVRFTDCNFTNIDANYGSLMEINEGAFVIIEDSTFTQIFTLEEGSVIFAGYQNAIVEIHNSTFTNNYAVTGGVFNTESESVIRLYDCLVTNNFAITSAVIHVSNFGYFEIYNSILTGNNAISNSVSQIFDSLTPSIVADSQIYSNEPITSQELIDEITISCSKVCYLSSKFEQFLLANPEVYLISSSEYIFQTILGGITITNSTEIYNEQYILDSFSSTVVIEDTQIHTISQAQNMIKLTSCTVEIDNLDLYDIEENITATNPLIRIAFESNVTINSLHYYDSTGSLLVVLNSDLSIHNFEIQNVTSATNNNMLYVVGATGINLQDWMITETLVTGTKYLFLISESHVDLLENITISGINQHPLEFYSCDISTISTLTLENCSNGIEIQYSSVQLLENSTFKNLGSTSVLQGGAMSLLDSNITINTSVFEANTAVIGGAVSLSCTTQRPWQTTIENTTFVNNTAASKGGAIAYDLYGPTLDSNIYEGNSASYGDNIGSYPVKIKIKDSETDQITLEQVGSGITYENPFTLALYDNEDQIITTDSASQITITGNSTESITLGTNAVKVNNGEATFDNVIFISDPGSQNILFDIKSTALDFTKLHLVFGLSYEQEKITASFRWCKPGEQLTSQNSCETCSPGSYNFQWNSTECIPCLNQATCPGGYQIDVNPGNWRRTRNSTEIVDWPNEDACEGGFSEENEFPVNWASGYRGYLCSGCISDEETRYEQVDDFVWAKWPNPVMNALKVLGLFLLVVIFLSGLIGVNIRKRDVSQRSVLMRILTNHLQLLTLTFAYNMQFPQFLLDLIAPLSRANSSSESVVSFDWFAQESQLKLFTPSIAILKVFISALSPIMLMLVWLIFFSICHTLVPKHFTDFKRNLVISTITIIFLLHPTITTSAMGVFQCIDVDEDMSRVRIDLELEWYSYEHLFWAFSLGIPMIIVWVVGTPLLGLYALTKHRKTLDTKETKRYYIVMYQGLRNETYYWEFVNIVRKVLLLSFNVFLPHERTVWKGCAAIMLVIIVYRIQIKLHPYVLKENNDCELISSVATGLTLGGGLVFASDETVAVLDLIIFLMI